MKRCVASVSAIAVMLCVGPALAQQKAKAQNVPEIPYTSVPNFLKLPAGEYLGESVGVATNSKGHVFVYHRSANTRLFEFDQNGNFLKEIGKGYYGFEFAHSVRVDAQDNIWTVDEGTNMVTKFSPDGKVLMVLGRRPPAVEGAVATPTGPNKPAEKYIFCRPTDVGWDPQGNIFVSDGYCNNRVVKFDKNGRFVAQVGQRKVRQGTRRVLSCRTGSRSTGRATSTSPTAPTSATRSSTTTSSRRRSTTRSAWAGPSAFRTGRTSTCSLPTPIPTATCPGTLGDHRRDLQDGTGRHDHRQVRPCQQGIRRLPGRSHDGLPQPERDRGRRNRILARAEAHPASRTP